MIKDALQYITEFLDKRDKAQVLTEDEFQKTILVNGEEKTYDKKRFTRAHTFFSVPGLMDYLHSEANKSASDKKLTIETSENPCNEIGEFLYPGVVFIGGDMIRVNMEYGSNIDRKSVV